MSLSIKDQFDLSWKNKFIIDETSMIIESGVFYDGLDKHVLNAKFAIRILRLIESGKVDIFRQERIFMWLDRYYQLVRFHPSLELSNAFYAAMSALKDKTDARFRRRGYRSRLNKAEASEYFGFGGNAGLISYGIREMRYIANREAYKHIGYKYGNTRPKNQVDFPAMLKFYIVNPKDAAYANSFPGCYEGGAIITKIEDGKWEMVFRDYYINTEYEHRWSFDIWFKIFKAIEKFASQLFEADIQIKSIRQFDN